jgi:hypothetical protein
MSKGELAYCRRCECDRWHNVELTESGPHYGRLKCSDCDMTLHWIPKPKNEGKRKKNKYTPTSLGLNYCQMCFRDRGNLINSETLEVHHIQEICDSGLDTPENIWVVCTYCHKLIHNTRIYIRRNDGSYTR